MVINNLMFSLIDSFLAQLEHCSWAFKAGNPSPLVCVSLSYTLFFLMPVTSKCLSRRLC